jgi:DNA-binding transcriptional regulator of glucitol operon
MNTYEDLEQRVKAQGVRVEQRLKLLRTLQKYSGGEQLADLVAEHERAIEEAARKVREVMR